MENPNQVNFTGEVINLGETTLENSNGTPYRLGTVSFVNKAGKTVQRSFMAYQAALDAGNLQAGQQAQFVAENVNGVVNISYQLGAGRASLEDFGF